MYHYKKEFSNLVKFGYIVTHKARSQEILRNGQQYYGQVSSERYREVS